jgi:hypothetical protein
MEESVAYNRVKSMEYDGVKPRTPVEERFWRKVSPEPMSGCWLWIGCVNTGGYGTIYFRGYGRKAHRVSWFLVKGEIPRGKFVLHKCDTPACVNPDHLFLGTQRDNVIDCVKKKRWRHGAPFGEKNPMSVLTDELVRQMRSEPRSLSYKKIGQKYGVSTMTAYRAIVGKSWEHIQ